MKETKIEYMKRRLDEFRIMNPEKTLPLQRDFPNCEKYEKCCTKDEGFWKTLQERVKELKPTLQPFRIRKQTHVTEGKTKPMLGSIFDVEKSPDGFDGW